MSAHKKATKACCGTRRGPQGRAAWALAVMLAVGLGVASWFISRGYAAQEEREGERGDRPAAGREEAPRRPAESEGIEGLGDFKPQTDREEMLFRTIQRLQREVTALRRQVNQMRESKRDGEGPRKAGPRDGEGPPRKGPRDGEGPPRKGPRDGEGPPKPGPRDGVPPPPRGEKIT